MTSRAPIRKVFTSPRREGNPFLPAQEPTPPTKKPDEVPAEAPQVQPEREPAHARL